MTSNSTDGTDTFNQEFSRYDQVEKLQRYRLSEDAEDKFDDNYELQTCDIGEFISGDEAGKAKFSQELGKSLEDIGFAIITGHGVSNQLYTDARALIAELFENNSVDSSMKFRAER
ncbi:MAG: hypothetical protein JKX73_06275, partial [Flavobacteriales bacterium]|nr:hypothetical protein [Flavobacteriales bacterium]